MNPARVMVAMAALAAASTAVPNQSGRRTSKYREHGVRGELNLHGLKKRKRKKKR